MWPPVNRLQRVSHKSRFSVYSHGRLGETTERDIALLNSRCAIVWTGHQKCGRQNQTNLGSGCQYQVRHTCSKVKRLFAPWSSLAAILSQK